ncbi:hypothetical protein LguiB_012576 [Lonicera macranthoides]
MGSMPVEFWSLLLVEISFASADVLLELELIILIQVELYLPCCHMVPPSLPHVDCTTLCTPPCTARSKFPEAPFSARPCFLIILTPMCSTAPSQHLCAPFNLTVHMPMRSSVQRPCSALPWPLPLCCAHARVQHGSAIVAFLSAPAPLASQHDSPWPSQLTQSPMPPQ